MDLGPTINEAKTERWWVAFGNGTSPRRWYDRMGFTRPGFRHCFAFRQAHDHIVLMVDPVSSRVATEVAFVSPWRLIDHYKAAGWRVLVVERSILGYSSGPSTMARMVGVTCASMVSYLLGLDRLALTPRGLWIDLIQRHRAKEV